MNEKLKPCPFCGGDAEVISCMNDWAPGGYQPDGSRVVCRNKACSGIGQPAYCDDQEPRAIANWNRRAPNPAVNVGAVVKELSALLSEAKTSMARSVSLGANFSKHDVNHAAWLVKTAMDRLAAISALTSPQGEETPAAPSRQVDRRAKAEAFDRIIEARRKHVDACKAYNARRDLVEAERSRNNWSLKMGEEYRAMSNAQSEYHRTVQELADAALAATEGSADV
jgi:hypothetical protein